MHGMLAQNGTHFDVNALPLGPSLIGLNSLKWSHQALLRITRDAADALNKYNGRYLTQTRLVEGADPELAIKVMLCCE